MAGFLIYDTCLPVSLINSTNLGQIGFHYHNATKFVKQFVPKTFLKHLAHSRHVTHTIRTLNPLLVFWFLKNPLLTSL